MNSLHEAIEPNSFSPSCTSAKRHPTYLTVFIDLFNFAYFRHARGTVFAVVLAVIFQDKLQGSGRTTLSKPTQPNCNDVERHNAFTLPISIRQSDLSVCFFERSDGEGVAAAPGDQLAGVAATSAEERVIAQMVLADLPLKPSSTKP